MFFLALSAGVFGYCIFLLGLTGLLYKQTVWVVAFFYCFILLLYYQKKIQKIFQKKIKFSYVFLVLFLLILTNLIGVFGPELGFDALWYHLTLPKLYLTNHAITFFSGGLLYYSAMPKLTELFYVVALALQGEILAKFIHFIFGIFSCVALYKLARIFLDKKNALLSVLIFYSNLVVAWESITAYVDLTRTFYETLVLLTFFLWYQTRKQKWFYLSAVLLGFAIMTKLLAIGSLVIFIILIIVIELQNKKISWINLIINIVLICFISIFMSLPWYIFSFVHTGNLIYPFFTDIYRLQISFELLNPLKFILTILNFSLFSPDPISPLYLIFLPVLIYYRKKIDKKMKILVFYSFLALIIWYITPQTGGGRFILPYLPALSILVAFCISQKPFQKIGLVFVLTVAFITVCYRGIANTKYLPVIFKQETKSSFLSNHLDFYFGDFYDVDNFFSKKLKPQETVLLYGFHNVYYIDFPFIDSSWVKKGDRFTYVATQNTVLPKRFHDWKQIYQNSKTNVKVYMNGEKVWKY